MDKTQQDNSIIDPMQYIDNVKPTTKSPLVIVIGEIFPLCSARLIFTLQQFISLFLQFTFVYKDNMLIYSIFYAIINVIQSLSIGTQIYFSQIASQALYTKNESRADYFNKITIRLSLIEILLGICLFYPVGAIIINKFQVPKSMYFQLFTNSIFLTPFQVFVTGQVIRYGIEDRSLIKTSVFIVYSVIFVSFESLIYFFIPVNTTVPTGIVFMLSVTIISIWTIIWNNGYSCFGIINKMIIKTDWKQIFVQKLDKQELLDMSKSLSLSISLTFIKVSLGVGILLSAGEISNSTSRAQQSELLLVYSYFGQIFRIVSSSVSEFFIKHTFACISRKQHKHLLKLILNTIIIGIILNGTIMLLLMFLPILKLFLPFRNNIKQPILFSGIAGMCSIFSEISVILALAHSHYIIMLLLGCMNLVGLFVSQFLFNCFLGQEQSFFKISFWGEVSAGISSLAVLVCYIISFNNKSKIEEKDKKQQKK